MLANKLPTKHASLNSRALTAPQRIGIRATQRPQCATTKLHTLQWFILLTEKLGRIPLEVSLRSDQPSTEKTPRKSGFNVAAVTKMSLPLVIDHLKSL